jgi:hypothetical protein
MGGGLTGFTGGPLVRYRSTARCGIEFVDLEGNDRCAASISTAADVYVVHGALAFAAQANALFRYEGEHWVSSAFLELSVSISKLWASESTVLLATNEGPYVSHGSGAPVLEDLPATDAPAVTNYPTAVWGFSDEEPPAVPWRPSETESASEAGWSMGGSADEGDPLLSAWESAFLSKPDDEEAEAPRREEREGEEPSLRELFWGEE